jgi:hypothetical protein
MSPSRGTAAESTRSVRADLLPAALTRYPSASTSTSPCVCPRRRIAISLSSSRCSVYLDLSFSAEGNRGGREVGAAPALAGCLQSLAGGEELALLAAKLLPCVLTARPLPAQICAPSSHGKRLVQWRFVRAAAPYRPSPATAAAGGPYGGARVPGRRLPY